VAQAPREQARKPIINALIEASFLVSFNVQSSRFKVQIQEVKSDPLNLEHGTLNQVDYDSL
jgi:hypothetical protein